MVLLLIVLIVFYSIIYFTSNYFIYDLESYVSLSIVIYWLVNILYFIKYKNRESLFCFEFLFSISYFLGSFILFFIAPGLDKYQSQIYVLDEHTVFKSYTISIIGYLSYLVGLTSFSKKSISVNINSTSNRIRFIFNDNACIISNLLCSLFIILFFINGGIKLLFIYSATLYDINRFGNFGSYLTYSVITSTIALFITISKIKEKGKAFLLRPIGWIFIINTSILLLFLIVSGLRSAVLHIAIPLLLVYSDYLKKIRFKSLLIIVLFGWLFFTYIRFLRVDSDFSYHNASWQEYVLDFFPANASITFFVNYVDNYGCVYGQNMLFQLLSIIPFAQSFILRLMGGSFAETSSGFYTNYFDRGSGLGTSLVGDVYYSFGIWGIYLLMFVYGYFVKKINNNQSVYGYLLYLIFTSNAIFAARVEYLYIVRNMSFSLIFMWLIIIVCGKPKTKSD